jgi:MFS family permease
MSEAQVQHPPLPPTRLSRDRDFVRFWAGETVSLFGSQVTALALPLTAVLLLGAGAAELGLLGAAAFAPFLLLTLPAGALIDRVPRRPVLILSNVARAAIIGTVPLAAALGGLRMELLYVVAFLGGSLSVAFELAYQAYLPGLVSADRLVPANSALQASSSAADVGGPGIGGILVQAVGAPVALVVDAASYAFSAISLASIRKPERPLKVDRETSLRTGMVDGFRRLLGSPVLRGMCAESATFNLFETAVYTLFILYATRTLGLGAATLGVVLAVGAVGSLVGAVLAGPAARRFGVGRTTVGAMVVACAAPLLVPLAGGPQPVLLAILIGSFALQGVGVAASNVHVVTIRQASIAPELYGRVNAAYRTLVTGAVPIGALLAGWLGSVLELRVAIAVGAVALLSSPIWVLLSPLPKMIDIPRPVEGGVA